MDPRTLVPLLATLLFAPQTSGATVTFDSLLQEMTNRAALARFPSPAYTCSQASSYDRGSVAPDQPGWFANMDRSHFVRTEDHGDRTEYVLMDVEGPGTVVRFWATWHGPGGKNFSDGTLRFYLDGEPEPVIEGPISEVLDGGGLVKGCLAEGVSPQTGYGQRGHNLYLPIPYANHCKVTYETDVLVDRGAPKGEALYYQINYRTYADETPVESFSLEKLEAAKPLINQIQERLVVSGTTVSPLQPKTLFTYTLAPGESQAIDWKRPGAIRQLTVKLKADNLPQALRSTVLIIEFDKLQTVWCPVGAFFGRGYQSSPHRTWYTEVQEDGTMNCYWVMPFAQQCSIRLSNLSDQPVEIEKAEIRVSDWNWDERSMHFHGTWYQLTEISSFREGASQPGEGAFDVNYVTAQGQGVYVGDTLTIFNGTDAWWGEGDEKIFVDGEAFPSHIGTGTEDYYGYAWCRPEFFASPFHAQPSGAGNIRSGFSVNSRYRSLDSIPFTRSFQFDMELWHWRNTTVNFAPATFWYARPGSTHNIEPDPGTAAKTVALKRADIVEVFRVKDALEGEDLKILRQSGGEIENQQVSQWRWSNDTQLWWKFGKPGERLLLEFPVAKAGRYRVIANLTKAVDYGIVRLAIDNQSPKQFDRYFTEVSHDELELGEFDLAAGPHRLEVEIVGANENAIESHMFGLDYLRLVNAN